MYEKNLTKTFSLKLSQTDIDFLKELSSQRSITVSECVRSIIGEYRRSLETLDILKALSATVNKGGANPFDNIETDFHDKL